MAHVLSGRAETPTQSRILTHVRDEGPLSRMDLAARLGVSRTTVAAEVGRLVELGLAEDGGPAASRGGRRSTLVDLDAGLRFVGIDLGATSMRVAVTDGRLGRPGAGLRAGRRHPARARAGAGRGDRAHPQAARRTGRRAPRRGRDRRARGRWTSTPACRCRRRSCRAGTATRSATRSRASSAARCCWTTTSTSWRWASSTPASPGRRRGVPVRQDRHRHRLRHRRRPASLPRRRRVRRRHRPHPDRAGGPGVRLRQPGLPGGVLRRGRAGARRGHRRAGRAVGVLAEMLEQDGELTARERRPCVRSWRRGRAAADPGRRAPRGVGAGQPGLVLQSGPHRHRGRCRRPGHTLLAEIRSAIYRQSLPLATGNLPVVLSELGGDAGVIGAARLVSDAVYAAA